MLIAVMGSPLVSASLSDIIEGIEYHYRDPDEIVFRYFDDVDVFLDHGWSEGQTFNAGRPHGRRA